MGEITNGQRAYEAYREHTGGKTYDGRDMPTWAELVEKSPKIAGAWEAAGAAVYRVAVRGTVKDPRPRITTPAVRRHAEDFAAHYGFPYGPERTLLVERLGAFFNGMVAELLEETNCDSIEQVLAQHLGLSNTILDLKQQALGRAVERKAHLSFAEALQAARGGARVSREAWKNRNAWVAMTPGSIIPVEQARAGAAYHLACAIGDPAAEFGIRPHLDMAGPDGSLHIGWTPSQDDLFAEDWFVVEDT